MACPHKKKKDELPLPAGSSEHFARPTKDTRLCICHAEVITGLHPGDYEGTNVLPCLLSVFAAVVFPLINVGYDTASQCWKPWTLNREGWKPFKIMLLWELPRSLSAYSQREEYRYKVLCISCGLTSQFSQFYCVTHQGFEGHLNK